MNLLATVRSLFASIFGSLDGGKFLCDNCRYDYDGACRRPERPNATRCPDHKPR